MKKCNGSKRVVFMVLFILGVLFLFVNFGNAQSAQELPYDAPVKSAVHTEDKTVTRIPMDEVTITMDLKDASLKDVLKIFSQQSGLNFIASEDVEDRTITLYLEDVTVQDALDNITKANDLKYEQIGQGGIFIVKPIIKEAVETVTKIYTLKYARVSTSHLERSAFSLAGTTTGQVGSLSATETGGGSSSGSAASAGIDLVVKDLLTNNGKLIVDVRTNSLIITDLESRFPVIEKVISELDVPTAQVIIEAEIMETTSNTLKELGLEWGSSEGTVFSVSAATRSTNYPFGDFVTDKDLSKYGDETNRTSEAGTINPIGFSAILNMLENDSETRILARPRLLTLDNESAIIKIMTDAAIGTKGTMSSETAAVIVEEAERAEVGISLVVTPQINDNGYITMVVEPAVSGAIASNIVGFYDTTTRGASTVVRIRDNETVVFAGLISKEQTSTDRRVPFFSNLPIVGDAFKSNSDTAQDRELLIFITPHIVKEPDLDNYAKEDFSDITLHHQDYVLPKDLAIEMALMDAEDK